MEVIVDKFPEHIVIEKKLPKAVYDWHAQHQDRTMIVDGNQILEISRILKEELGYNFLVDITCVDYLPRKPRFEIVYHYMNMETKARLRVKIQSDDQKPEVASLTSLWLTANWLEREVWDMYGVRFEGHPDLKRILLYEGFEGHPLRKDYPKQKRQPLIGPKN
jgi:NADH-quinone oxidoreductase subunit C